MTPQSASFDWGLIVAEEKDVEPAVMNLTDHMDIEQKEKFRVKLLRYARKSDRALILAVAGLRVIGFYTVIEYDDPPPELPDATTWRLRRFACGTGFRVHPDWRRRGVGASVQLRAEQWAQERGKPGFWLSTRRRDWYIRHFSYEEVGRVTVKGVERSIMAKDFLS